MSKTIRVAIIHPWFPQYRAPFFERLLHVAAEKGISIDIFHGSPPPEWNERGDSTKAPYATRLETRFITLGSRSFVKKNIAPVLRSGPYDLIVLEQAVRNLESYRLLMDPRLRIAFWGHGRTYTQRSSRMQENIKSSITRRGRWFFGYTQGGVDAVTSGGFPAARTTVVANSTDTSSLVAGIEAVRQEELSAFSREHDLRGKTALFIGGLDHAKRMRFLLDAATTASSIDPNFRLIIAGDGEDRELVRAAAERNVSIKYLGPLFGDKKYLAFASSQVVAMPGRVGLVAVDSLATGRPIVTTDWPHHAPEFEYLTPGQDCLVTPNDPSSYGAELAKVLANKARLDKLSSRALASAPMFSIERMADNFVRGLVGATAP